MVSSFQDTPMEHTAFESLYVGKTNQQAREQVGWGGGQQGPRAAGLLLCGLEPRGQRCLEIVSTKRRGVRRRSLCHSHDPEPCLAFFGPRDCIF